MGGERATKHAKDGGGLPSPRVAVERGAKTVADLGRLGYGVGVDEMMQ